MTRDPARMHRYDEGTEALAHAVLAYALERVRLDPPPLDRPRTSAELDRLGESITADGMGSMAALRLFCEHLAPACITQDHPRQLAFVPSAPTEAAVLFDLVVGASCIYAGSWMEGAGAVWAENHALRWIADLVGLPAAAGGVFLSGGSAGNLSALVAARHRARAARPDGDGRPRWWVAASAGVHASVEAAARVMDVEVLKVPTDERGRMTGDALRAELWRAGLVGPNSAPAGGEAGAERLRRHALLYETPNTDGTRQQPPTPHPPTLVPHRGERGRKGRMGQTPPYRMGPGGPRCGGRARR